VDCAHGELCHNEEISDDGNNLAAPRGVGTCGARSELQSDIVASSRYFLDK
jgi:hypothetical protein